MSLHTWWQKNSTSFILRDKKVFKMSLDMKMCTIFECASLTMNEKPNWILKWFLLLLKRTNNIKRDIFIHGSRSVWYNSTKDFVLRLSSLKKKGSKSRSLVSNHYFSLQIQTMFYVRGISTKSFKNPPALFSQMSTFTITLLGKHNFASRNHP